MKAISTIEKLSSGDQKTLAKAISWVENDSPEGRELLQHLPFQKNVPVVGITGPPGAGKSSLVNSMVSVLLKQKMKIGVLAVDPTSPFNYGSLLGDRIRLSEHFNDPSVFIRSIATRGSLGGLSARIFEITDVMRHADFDIILIETVGVGQSEVEIAGLADTTIVVMVPEAGDEIQTIKSGIMEIADIFVVNKADRVGADSFANSLKQLLHSRPDAGWSVPVLLSVAVNHKGINEILEAVFKHHSVGTDNSKKVQLIMEKAIQLIANERMKSLDVKKLCDDLSSRVNIPGFNLYTYLQPYYRS